MHKDNPAFLNRDMAAILDELFDGVYILDTSRRIVFWNRGAEEISGFHREQMTGLHCHAGPLKHEDEQGHHLCESRCPAESVLKSGKPEVAVIFMHNAAGIKIPVETHIRPLNDDRGNITGAIEVFRDISQWKTVEQLSLEKDRLMGILAHDIRNPLSVIRSYAGVLRRHQDGSVKEIGDVLEKRVGYALGLVNDLLDAQAIKDGHINLTVSRVKVADVIRQAIYNYQAPAEAKQITIRYEEQAGHIMLLTDEVRLEELINNLLSNAVNYSSAGTAVTVSLAAASDEMILKITDQGMGIKPEEQQFLFKVFGKTSNKPTAGEASHGLGLFIVKKIVDLFSGRITLDSTPGRGTTVTVMLPYTGDDPYITDYQI